MVSSGTAIPFMRPNIRGTLITQETSEIQLKSNSPCETISMNNKAFEITDTGLITCSVDR